MLVKNISLRLSVIVLCAAVPACGGGNDFPESDTPPADTAQTGSSTPPADTAAPANQPPPANQPSPAAPATSAGGSGQSGGQSNDDDDDDDDDDDEEEEDHRHGNRPNRPNRSINFSAFAVDSVPSSALTAHAADGSAVAVWREANGSGHDLWRNHLRAGTWDTPTLLELSAGDVGAVSVAMDPHGTAFVVWAQPQGATPAIWSARYTPTSGWSAPVVINAETIGANVAAPEVSFDATGNAIAQWQQTEGTVTRSWRNIYVTNSGWTGASAQ